MTNRSLWHSLRQTTSNIPNWRLSGFKRKQYNLAVLLSVNVFRSVQSCHTENTRAINLPLTSIGGRDRLNLATTTCSDQQNLKTCEWFNVCRELQYRLRVFWTFWRVCGHTLNNFDRIIFLSSFSQLLLMWESTQRVYRYTIYMQITQLHIGLRMKNVWSKDSDDDIYKCVKTYTYVSKTHWTMLVKTFGQWKIFFNCKATQCGWCEVSFSYRACFGSVWGLYLTSWNLMGHQI